MIRTTALLLLCLAILSPVAAYDGWVGNRSGTTANRFNTVGNTEIGTPITVGTTPIDMAQNNAEGQNPGRVYVVNFGSDNISVIDRGTLTIVQTITGTGSTFGTFESPSGIVRAANSTIDPTLAVVDAKVVGTGRSTVRFINPSNGSIVDGFQDMSASARYVDVAFSSGNTRLWVTDDGDKGVVVVKLAGQTGSGGQKPPAFPNLGNELIFQGAGEFADFIFDPDPVNAPNFLVAPQRVAISPDGNYVVVTDAGSALVTVINANFTSESSAVVANVSVAGLPGAPTATRDVVIVGTKAYVSTNAAGAGAIAVIELTAVTSSTVPTTIIGMAATADGLGRTPDNLKIYAGSTAGSGVIREIDPATDSVIMVFGPLTGGAFPFAFLFTGTTAGSGSVDPGFDGTNMEGAGGGSSSGCHGSAGGAGFGFPLLVVAALLALAVRRN